MTPADAENDRRSSPRRRTLKGAFIVFNEGRSTTSCVVRNTSATGALLRVESAIGLPSSFVLAMHDGRRFECVTVRRSAQEIAVRFVREITTGGTGASGA